VADLAWLRERGLTGAITERARPGRPPPGMPSLLVSLNHDR